jgi:hypothetical protein
MVLRGRGYDQAGAGFTRQANDSRGLAEAMQCLELEYRRHR